MHLFSCWSLSWSLPYYSLLISWQRITWGWQMYHMWGWRKLLHGAETSAGLLRSTGRPLRLSNTAERYVSLSSATQSYVRLPNAAKRYVEAVIFARGSVTYTVAPIKSLLNMWRLSYLSGGASVLQLSKWFWNRFVLEVPRYQFCICNAQVSNRAFCHPKNNRVHPRAASFSLKARVCRLLMILPTKMSVKWTSMQNISKIPFKALIEQRLQ